DNKHLDPCYWSTGAQLSVAASAAAAVSKNLALTPAATLQVRVDDPKKLADPKSSDILVAVIAPGGKLAPMNLVSSDASGKTYQLAVPPGPHKVFVRSNSLKIANGAGADIDLPADKKGVLPAPTIDTPVSLSAGTAYFAVTITGKR